jgi:hypothetical protein
MHRPEPVPTIAVVAGGVGVLDALLDGVGDGVPPPDGV